MPTTITLSQTAVTLNDGDTITVSATVRDQHGQPLAALPAGTALVWTSSAPDVASVTDGRITAHRPGSAQITARAGDASATLTVTVRAVPTAVREAGGNGQSGTVGATLPDSLAVRVVDRHGNGVSGVTVTWNVASGGGRVSSASSTTDANGVARTAWTLGTAVGEQTVTAQVAGLSGSPVVFRAQAVAGAPAEIRRISGDAQSAPAGSTLPAPLVVRVLDSFGNPVRGAEVAWTVTSGGGSITPARAATDSTGHARATWTLGTVLGEQRATATVSGLPAVVFSATAVTGGPAEVRRVSGDGQSAPAGSTLPAPLVVRVLDAGGNPVRGAEVVWAVASGGGTITPTRVSTDSTGHARATWTLGSTAGEQRATATVSGLPPAVFTATATAVQTGPQPPSITAVSPGTLTPGATATISGSNFSPTPGENTVTVAGVAATVTQATATQLTVVVPARNQLPCQPTRNVPVTVRVGQQTASREHPLSVAISRPLAVGESLLILSEQEVGCNELPQSGRYVISAFNTSTSPGASVAFQLRGNSGAATTTRLPAPIAGQASPRLGSASVPSRTFGSPEHLRIIEANRALYRAHRLRLREEPPVPRNVLRAPLPAVGDTLSFRIPKVGSSNLCTTYTEVRARAVYVGSRAVIFEDVAAPLAGQMDSTYRFAGREYDQSMHDILTANFGNPLAVDPATDNNQRIFMLFSKVVSDNSPGIAGFVFVGDFFPRSDCASSDRAEIFYARVPTSSASGFSGDTREQWLRTMRATIIHEVKHLVSYAERLRQNASALEESWLEESTARISEELWARTIFGYRQKGNTTYRESIYCEVRPTFSECAGKPLVMLSHFNGLYHYLVANGARTPLGRVSEDDYTFYGSGWSLVRWSIDRASLSESQFLRALVQEPSLTGVRNLVARVGLDFPTLQGEWSLALAVDDWPGFSPARAALTFPSWHLRDVFAGLNRDFPNAYPQAWPAAGRSLSFGSFSVDVGELRGGAATYFDLSGTSTTPQLLEVRGPTGGPPPTTLRLGIVRVQ